MRRFVFACLLALASADSQSRSSQDAIRQHYQAGEQALRSNDLPLAQTSFQQVLALAPEDVGARVNLAVVYMRESKWDAALRYLTEAEKRAPNVPGIELNIGLVNYRRGDYTAAIPAFASAVRAQPDNAQARHLLGLSYLFKERYADAAAALEPLWPQSNGDLAYLYSLSVAAGNAGNHALEEQAVGRLMQVGGDSPFVHLLKGKAYLAHEDFGNAEKEFAAALAGDPGLPLVHYNLGVVYRRQGKFEQAEQEFKQDLALEPTLAIDYDQLGELAYRQENLSSARLRFEKAVQLDPRLGTSWFGLAKVEKQDGHFAQALQSLARANAIDPDSASVHYLKAQILLALKRKPEAETEMATVRRLKAKNLDKLEAQVLGPSYRDPVSQ